MGLMADFFSNWIPKKSNSKKSDYIFYKIVEFSERTGTYIIQCINTKAVLCEKITHIVSDCDILYGLHPIQACYVGIEYAKYIKKMNTMPAFSDKQTEKAKKYSLSRYGRYALLHEERKNRLCFTDNITHSIFLMDAKDIARSLDLLEEFDAVDAFHIGFITGLKMDRTQTHQLLIPSTPPNLSIVK